MRISGDFLGRMIFIMKKRSLKKILIAISAAAITASCASCAERVSVDVISGQDGPAADQSYEETIETTKVTVTETEAQTEPEPDPALLAHNPLTGEFGYNADAVGKRPVAVMINNIYQSLPQYGIGAADHLYELVVEGGITRLMGVYADYTNVPDVCSIRSCRYYYPIIAYGMDAIYCHWGMDHTIAEETLLRLDIDRFDGDDDAYYDYLFYNDSERLEYYNREHTGVLDGSVLPEAIENAGYRTDSLYGSADMFNFAEGTELYEIPGVPCEEIVVYFSESYYSTFTYNSEDGKYYKQHSDEAHMDLTTGEQLSFTNVFALKTDVSMRGVGELMDVDLSSGSGYYLSGGRIQEIYWTKPAEDKGFVFTDTSGNDITINRGKCYFGLTDQITPYY